MTASSRRRRSSTAPWSFGRGLIYIASKTSPDDAPAVRGLHLQRRRYPMATPRYVAKKIGDEYVLQRKDAVGTLQAILFTLFGGVIALYGFHRRGLLGWLRSEEH